jgi:hypothetical protein
VKRRQPYHRKVKLNAPQAVEEKIERHRQSHVINRGYCRKWALDYAGSNRHHHFARVSEAWLNQVEAATKRWMADAIDRLPSKGETIR